MIKLSSTHFTLLLVSGSILLGSSACTTDPQRSTVRPTTPDAAPTVAMPSPAASPSPSLSAGGDPYQMALEKARSAQNFSTMAQSGDDWKLVAVRWQQAIDLLREVQTTSPNHAQAKARLLEYQRSLANARRLSSQTGGAVAAAPPSSSVRTSGGRPVLADVRTGVAPTSSGSFQVPIKRRQGGTPVIDVTFNGSQTFEMIVDTGASGTVITQEMAQALGVQPIGSARVDTASQQNVEVPLAMVQSISAGGVVATNVTVAIGGSALKVGLLGHNFFGNYDITVRQDVVEFQSRRG